MLCPTCGSEYRPGFDTCSACGAVLTDDPPLLEAPEPSTRVVFSDSRPDVIAIAKSILMSAELEFAVSNEGVQDLFGWGRFPVGTNAFVGPVELHVLDSEASDARALLAGLGTLEAGDTPAEAHAADDDDRQLGFFRRNTHMIVKVVAASILAYWIGGLIYAGISELLSLMS